jgi:hypothetical protein
MARFAEAKAHGAKLIDIGCMQINARWHRAHFGWLDGQADQRRLGAIGGESADGDGIRGVEAIVLNDDDQARFARVGLATGDSPDVAPPHSSIQSDTASMNA